MPGTPSPDQRGHQSGALDRALVASRRWRRRGTLVVVALGLAAIACTGAVPSRAAASGQVERVAPTGNAASNGRTSVNPAPVASEDVRSTVSPPMIVAGGGPQGAKASTTTMRSLNWSGYGVDGGDGAFDSVGASFVVPALVSCGADEDSASSFWVGLDGLASQTVEQDGVDASCDDGTAQYFPWYEVYPSMPVLFPGISVHPGDTVRATVTYLRGTTYSLGLTDVTHSTGGSVTASNPGATDSSAECIAEDPGSTPVPYADYGSVSFSGCTVNGTAIGAMSPWAITTVSSGGATEAAPSGLQGNSAFTVTRTTSATTGAAPPSPAPSTAPVPLTAPVVGMAATPSGDGYWLADASGAVSAHGGAKYDGSMAGVRLNSPIAHIVSTSDGLGYWLVAGDGGIFSFGDAQFYGSMGGHPLNAPVVDMAPTPDGLGYWLVAGDGGIFSFGDARFYGSMGGRRLNAPVVAIAADGNTGGYWETASDGGVFAFDAPFHGSTGGLRLDRPIVSMATVGSGAGYWFVAADGGIFSFGLPFHGSGGGLPIPSPIVGMAADSATDGYWMVGSNGSVYSFGAPFYGAD